MLELLAEDLQGGEVDIDDAQSLLERARAQSRRLGRLAADLLDLSRIDADVALRSEAVELGELCRAVLAEFELGSRERDVSCVLREHDGPVWALGDPGASRGSCGSCSTTRCASRRRQRDRDQPDRSAGADAERHRSRPRGRPTRSGTMIFERFKRGTRRRRRGRLRARSGDRPRACRADGRDARARPGDPGPGATFTLTLPVDHGARAGDGRTHREPIVGSISRDGRPPDARDARRRRPPLVVPRPSRRASTPSLSSSPPARADGCSTPAAARVARCSSSPATARCPASSSTRSARRSPRSRGAFEIHQGARRGAAVRRRDAST